MLTSMDIYTNWGTKPLSVINYCVVTFQLNRKQTKIIGTRAVLTRTKQLIGTNTVVAVVFVSYTISAQHKHWVNTSPISRSGERFRGQYFTSGLKFHNYLGQTSFGLARGLPFSKKEKLELKPRSVPIVNYNGIVIR